MKVDTIISDDMTLEEKLSAIDAAMKAAQEAANEQARKSGSVAAPLDPAMLTICDGCEQSVGNHTFKNTSCARGVFY